MMRKMVLAMCLAGLVVLSAACGRGRTAVATETPVPTVAATPTLTAVPVVMPTDEPTVEPTVEPAPTDEPTEEPTVAATASVVASEIATQTMAVTVTERITVDASITDGDEISASLEIADVVTPEADVRTTGEVTATGEITVTEAVSESVAVDDEIVVDEEVEVGQPVTLPVDLATSITLTHVRALSSLVTDVLSVSAELAPNGKQVAWLVPEVARRLAHLCIATFETGEQNCFTVEGYWGMPYRLAWSPDSRWIAFSEDPSAQAFESDIWLLDVVNGVVTNRSDDLAIGRYAEVDGDYALDYLPMWNVATGELYFWRSVPDEQDTFSLALMRLDVNGEDAPEVVRDFGQALGDGMVRFGWQRFYLQGPSAIAPDGSMLAVEIAPAQEMDVAQAYALWLIDLADVESEPRSLATSLDWQRALPQWSNQPAVVRGLQWTADGKGLVVAALSSDLRLPLLLPYYVDVASGEITPVLDFSNSVDRSAFFRVDPALGSAPRFAVPWTIGVVPNANVLLLVTDLGGATSIWGAPLPPMPDGDAPALLAQYRSPGYEAWTRSSGSMDGKVLIYGLLMQSVVE